MIFSQVRRVGVGQSWSLSWAAVSHRSNEGNYSHLNPLSLEVPSDFDVSQKPWLVLTCLCSLFLHILLLSTWSTSKHLSHWHLCWFRYDASQNSHMQHSCFWVSAIHSSYDTVLRLNNCPVDEWICLPHQGREQKESNCVRVGAVVFNSAESREETTWS